MSAVIVAILLANALYLILTKRAELRDGHRGARPDLRPPDPRPHLHRLRDLQGFGLLQVPRADARPADPRPRRGPDPIINVNGQVLFDSTSLNEAGSRRPPGPPSAGSRSRSGWRRSSGSSTRCSSGPRRRRRGDAGDHRPLPRGLGPPQAVGRLPGLLPQPQAGASRSSCYATGGLTLLSMLRLRPGRGAAWPAASPSPVEVLTAGAKDIAEGHFDRRLDIRSNDELQILAETFNHMTDRLKENVEQLEESNKKLAAVNEELKELDRMKSDLLANVSHELRTPLTAIKGYTDYILERKLGAITDKQEKGLVVVQRNLDRLSKSIDALLDFSRMDMGRIALNHPALQPGRAGRADPHHRALGAGEEAAHLRGRHRPRPARRDRRPREALRGPREPGDQRHQVHPRGRAASRWAARGPGAARSVGRDPRRRHRDRHPRRPDRQASSTASTRWTAPARGASAGVGLGLAIVKSILEAHGATITVESEPGKGTVFRFALPVLEKSEPKAVEDKARERGGAGARAGGRRRSRGGAHRPRLPGARRPRWSSRPPRRQRRDPGRRAAART